MNIFKLIVAGVLLGTPSAVIASSDGHEASGHIKAAVANSERSASDKASDAVRKPSEVLAFAGIKPGMTVLDVNSGHGYYTELLSHAVGREGKVIAHNGKLYWGYVKDNIAARYDGRLSNVTQVHYDHEKVVVPNDKADVAVLMIAFHDYYHYYTQEQLVTDMPIILASIKDALKDGGSFIISDHAARAGSVPQFGKTLHRIDPELVKKQVLAAGFEMVAASDALANAEDDHTLGVFDKNIRGKTDRFILKFKK